MKTALPIWHVTPEKLAEATRRLVEAAQPRKIILFGSRARGEQREDSDVDLLDVADELVGYHCQQAVEKPLKARLVDLGVNYPKTHNLQTLVELLEDQSRLLPWDLADLDLLTPYATICR